MAHGGRALLGACGAAGAYAGKVAHDFPFFPSILNPLGCCASQPGCKEPHAECRWPALRCDGMCR